MKYDILVAAAKAKRDKTSGKRWTALDKRAVVGNFLSSGNATESVTIGGKKPAYIVTSLNAIIKEDDLSELCYAVEVEDAAWLVSFAPDVEENDES